MTKITEKIKTKLAKRQYVASERIATVVYLAEELGKPILCEGPAGVGKTELGKVWAGVTGRQLIRLQCYEGLDESRALYEWEYAKQMLYTQLLRDQLKKVVGEVTSLEEAAQRIIAEESVFFSRHFLLPRPLLQALTSIKPAVLLIDEIDRADVEFLFITYPSLEQELQIVNNKVPELTQQLAKEAVELVHHIRKLDLKKHPSVGETIDWTRALLKLNASKLDPETVENTLSVLLKNESDIIKVEREIVRKL
ncbi:MAG: ATPase [Anaerolineaceae bacterium 4572_78]|nr:MAG: ATPase [Anaerolineaceae bacterium 4572_78]